jgi:8-oxo-dGTP pyrophosphatase MutT (NUDIX family)
MITWLDFLQEAEGYFDDGTGRQRWGKQAAGVLVVAKDTGNVLIVLRSNEVDNWLDEEPYDGQMWGVPGGAIHPEMGQSAENGVKHELMEETGYRGMIKLEKSYVHNNRFLNFIGLVPREFRCRLNWENDEYQWVNFERLIQSGREYEGIPLIDGFPEFLRAARARMTQILAKRPRNPGLQSGENGV